MEYDDVEQAILGFVLRASDADRRSFGVETVVRLTSYETLEDAANAEFDDEALRAFELACANAATADGAELRGYLVRVDEGVLSDGDMDPEVLLALSALEHWTAYLEEGSSGELYELAIRSIEEVDFQVSADLGDFLADPAMAAEYARIERLLPTA
jgi:hypothetical protein